MKLYSAVFCRCCLLLVIACTAVLVFGAMVASMTFAGAMLVTFSVVIIMRRKQHFDGDAYGTATLASNKDLARAGAFNGEGLLIGNHPFPDKRSALKNLVMAPLSESEIAVKLAGAAFKRKDLPVTLNGLTHVGVFAPTGSGKSAGVLIPWLLNPKNNGSCVIVDVKGELYKASHKFRRKLGRVIVIDPFKLVTESPDTLNPFWCIDPSKESTGDTLMAMIEAIIPPEPNAKEPHWIEMAQSLATTIAGAVLTLAPSKNEMNMESLISILSDPAEVNGATNALKKSNSYGGALSRAAYQLDHLIEKERGSVLTTTLRHFRFASNKQVLESLSTSSFNPADLRKETITVYLILPSEYLKSHSSLLRLWLTTLDRAIMCTTGRGGGARNPVTFHIDEMGAIGQLRCVEEALNQYRGYGVRMFTYFQGMDQLKVCFPQDQHTVALGNMTQMFFGVNDMSTAEYISKRTGQLTLNIANASRNYSDNTSVDHLGHENRSRGWSYGMSNQQLGRAMFFPDEVLRWPPRDVITFTPKLPPVLTTLDFWFEKKTGLIDFNIYRETLKYFAAAIACIAAIAIAAYAIENSPAASRVSQKPINSGAAK